MHQWVRIKLVQVELRIPFNVSCDGTLSLLMVKCAPMSIKRTMLHVAVIYCMSLMVFLRGIHTFQEYIPARNYVGVELQSYLVPRTEFNSINFHPPLLSY